MKIDRGMIQINGEGKTVFGQSELMFNIFM